MRGRYRVFGIIMTVVFVLPIIMLTVSLVDIKSRDSQQTETAVNPTVTVWRSKTKTVEEMSLEDFLVGVVSAEMPASFESEALKAQAVAARSYVVKRLPPPYGSGLSVHEANATTCDDFAHCQAFNDAAQRQSKWGDNFPMYEQKVTEAVQATAGQILTYEGELVSPSFHSTCGGMTEAAGDYWQNNVPALQAVPCVWDTSAPRYLSKVFLSKEDLAAKLKVLLDSLPKLKISKVSSSGRVMKISCGDKTWKGSEFRTLLGLNSTAFTWLSTEEGYFFTVQGYGHGVGLCQHGANGMAAQGKTYEEILHHYYTDVDITPIQAKAVPTAKLVENKIEKNQPVSSIN